MSGNTVALQVGGHRVSLSNPLPVTLAGPAVATPPSSFVPVTATGDVVTLTAGQRLFVQNLGTEPLYVKRGTGASATSFNYALAGGDSVNDGLGGWLDLDDFVGVVSAFGASPRFIAWIR